MRGLYQWTLSLAASPRAVPALAAVSFAESSFFPIPPDVVLVPMALAKPKRAWWFAFVCTIASVAGGLLGYAIGYLLYDSVGAWLINLYGYGQKIEALREFYGHWGWAFILVKGLTPIPFKLITIVSGLLGYDLALFVLMSLVTRGLRFFMVAAALNAWGDSLRPLIDKHFVLFVGLVLALAAAGVILAAKLF